MNVAVKFKKEIAELKQTLFEKQQRIELLEELLRTSKQRQFGTSSEKHPAQQALFNEAEEIQADENSLDADEEASVDVPAHTRKRKKRVSIPESIEREEIVYDLDDTEKVCPHDGAALRHIGDETHEQLDIIPAQIKALRHIRKKYACPCCEQYLVTA